MPIIQSIRRISPLDSNKNVRVGVAFPLNDDNIFNGTQTVKEQVKSNLVNVLLTERGERINEPNFGVGLKKILFETNVDTAELNSRISQQIEIFIPEITLISAETNFSPDEHILYIIITYRYNPSNEVDAIQLNFNVQS